MAVKLFFCWGKMTIVKITKSGKVEIRKNRYKNNYVNKMRAKETKTLWKTPVEKPVENVEKLVFSTEKPGFSNCSAGEIKGILWINRVA